MQQLWNRRLPLTAAGNRTEGPAKRRRTCRHFEPLEPRLCMFATGGDFNGDGIVAASDLVLVRTHWGTVVEEQLEGWVGMQPDERVDQNELDAVLLNWLQLVDPATQGGANAAAAPLSSAAADPQDPAPLLANALSAAADDPGEPARSDKAAPAERVPTLRSLRAARDIAYAAISNERASRSLDQENQAAGMRSTDFRQGYASVGQRDAVQSARDAAFGQAGPNGWLARGRLAIPSDLVA